MFFAGLGEGLGRGYELGMRRKENEQRKAIETRNQERADRRLEMEEERWAQDEEKRQRELDRDNINERIAASISQIEQTGDPSLWNQVYNNDIADGYQAYLEPAKDGTFRLEMLDERTGKAQTGTATLDEILEHAYGFMQTPEQRMAGRAEGIKRRQNNEDQYNRMAVENAYRMNEIAQRNKDARALERTKQSKQDQDFDYRVETQIEKWKESSFPTIEQPDPQFPDPTIAERNRISGLQRSAVDAVLAEMPLSERNKDPRKAYKKALKRVESGRWPTSEHFTVERGGQLFTIMGRNKAGEWISKPVKSSAPAAAPQSQGMAVPAARATSAQPEPAPLRTRADIEREKYAKSPEGRREAISRDIEESKEQQEAQRQIMANRFGIDPTQSAEQVGVAYNRMAQNYSVVRRMLDNNQLPESLAQLQEAMRFAEGSGDMGTAQRISAILSNDMYRQYIK